MDIDRPSIQLGLLKAIGEAHGFPVRTLHANLDLAATVPGARHDSNAPTESGIADRWASHLKPGGPGPLADLGYLGIAAITGIRKPPKADLTDVQRDCDTAINSARAAVDRAIAHLPHTTMRNYLKTEDSSALKAPLYSPSPEPGTAWPS
jgi:hypothetical protein